MTRTLVWSRNGTPLREYKITLPLLADGAPQSTQAYVDEAIRTKRPRKFKDDRHARYTWTLADD